MDDGSFLYKLTFKPGPAPGSLVMPDNFRKEIERYRRAMTPPSFL
jgi:hypothetical protein